jgi:hypothetical protein
MFAMGTVLAWAISMLLALAGARQVSALQESDSLYIAIWPGGPSQNGCGQGLASAVFTNITVGKCVPYGDNSAYSVQYSYVQGASYQDTSYLLTFYSDATCSGYQYGYANTVFDGVCAETVAADVSSAYLIAMDEGVSPSFTVPQWSFIVTADPAVNGVNTFYNSTSATIGAVDDSLYINYMNDDPNRLSSISSLGWSVFLGKLAVVKYSGSQFSFMRLLNESALTEVVIDISDPQSVPASDWSNLAVYGAVQNIFIALPNTFTIPPGYFDNLDVEATVSIVSNPNSTDPLEMCSLTTSFTLTYLPFPLTTTCSAGYYLSDVNPSNPAVPPSTFCASCPLSHFCTDNQQPMECPEGTFNPLLAQPYCTACPAGYWSNLAGQSYQYSCIMCMAGTYSDMPGANSVSSCLACPVGTAMPYPAATSCEFCTPGYYSPSSGQRTCTLAPAGTYVADAGAITTTPCPNGTTSVQGSTSASACTSSCEPGMYRNADACDLCSIGQYCSDGTSYACPVGTYTDLLAMSVCVSCPEGSTTVSTGSTSSADCFPCSVGTYYDTTTDLCLLCPVNTYSPQPGAIGIDSCLAEACSGLTICNYGSSGAVPISVLLLSSTDGATQQPDAAQLYKVDVFAATNISSTQAGYDISVNGAQPLKNSAVSLTPASFEVDEPASAQQYSQTGTTDTSTSSGFDTSLSTRQLAILSGTLLSLALLSVLLSGYMPTALASRFDQFSAAHHTDNDQYVKVHWTYLGFGMTLSFLFIAILVGTIIGTAINSASSTTMIPTSSVTVVPTANIFVTMKVYSDTETISSACSSASGQVTVSSSGFSNPSAVQYLLAADESPGIGACTIFVPCYQCSVSTVSSVQVVVPYAANVIEMQVETSAPDLGPLAGTVTRLYSTLGTNSNTPLDPSSQIAYSLTIEMYDDTISDLPVSSGFATSYISYTTLESQPIAQPLVSDTATVNFVFTTSDVAISQTVTTLLSPVQIAVSVVTSIVSLLNIWTKLFGKLESGLKNFKCCRRRENEGDQDDTDNNYPRKHKHHSSKTKSALPSHHKQKSRSISPETGSKQTRLVANAQQIQVMTESQAPASYYRHTQGQAVGQEQMRTHSQAQPQPQAQAQAQAQAQYVQPTYYYPTAPLSAYANSGFSQRVQAEQVHSNFSA